MLVEHIVTGILLACEAVSQTRSEASRTTISTLLAFVISIISIVPIRTHLVAHIISVMEIHDSAHITARLAVQRICCASFTGLMTLLTHVGSGVSEKPP